MFNIVLLEPEIPFNTGNIGRTCVATGTRLHLIRPLGFELDDKHIKRSGLDYWQKVDLNIYDDLSDFLSKNPEIRNGKLLNGVNYHENLQEKAGAAGHIEIALPAEEKAVKAAKADLYYATTKCEKCYSEASFKDGDYIMFGKESAGIPEEILEADKEHCIRIPMLKEERSLNLSNSAAIILYEALRQIKFVGLETQGHMHRIFADLETQGHMHRI